MSKEAKMNLHSHRKDEHVMIAEKLYRQKSTNGLERIRLIPANLPEISLDEISLSTTLAGKKLEAPFSSMPLQAEAKRQMR